IVGGAFVHLDKIIAKRLGKTTIGFDAAESRTFDTQETNYLLSKVEPEDLIQFGMIPEFVGRFNSIANSNELTIEDLVTILVTPKNAIIKQYQHLFGEENVKLHFTEEALRAMGEKAKETG
ncbi:MAG: ATP-dependent Clp protease ATP-binding subunit ClpX, partial [Chlamydiota bacterium]